MALTLKWKIIIPVVVILALIAGYLQYKNKQQIEEESTNIQGQQDQQGQLAQQGQAATTTIVEVTPPAATGNVDETIDALLQESSSEAGAFQEEMDSANIVADDSQAISDFGQSYNEKEF